MAASWRDIAAFFEAMELRLIASFKRNLAAHKKWERDEEFQWPAWQAVKLRNIERFRKQNQKIMEEYHDVIDNETRRLMKEQFLEGYEESRHEISSASWSGRSQESWSGRRKAKKPLPRASESKAEDIPFFGVNAPRMERLMEAMLETEERAETAALRLMDDVYRQTILRTATAMAAGSTTLPQAIDLAAKDFLAQGIKCIEYKNGRRVHIADYVQMALRAAATRSMLQGEAQRRAELGIDTVRVSQYGQCSNTCLPWQGKVYIDDVWGVFDGETRSGTGKGHDGGWYPLLSLAVKAGLFHPSCRHTLTTWTKWNTPAPLMDAERIKRDAALEATQRKLERDVRFCKRFAAGSQEPEQAKKYAKEVRIAQKALRDFIAAHDDALRRDDWRERIY